ncbi:MAG TPA: deoxyhypusine synthase [bacterium]|nr:deoxyhypusine synthase [bacterium]
MSEKSSFLKGKPIRPEPIEAGASVADLVDKTFLAYNAARLREGCRLYVEKMLQEGVTVGMSLTGALTPAGLGRSCLIPLMKMGFVDWIVSTGANLYHDTHFSLGFNLHQGTPFLDDRQLRKEQVIRIYDILFEYDVLLSTDAFYRQVMSLPEFQKVMGTAEFHYRVGKYVRERERALSVEGGSILSVAHEVEVPIFTSSPGDSSIGMNIAALALEGNQLQIDPNVDVNQTAAIVWQARRKGGGSGLFILGGGSPKNFVLQTEPYIQEILGIEDSGHDYFLQITDARPDTGGLSGATPSEAVSWGKVDPDKLPDAVVAYVDSTIALPLITAYAFSRREPREPKRLYGRLEQWTADLRQSFLSSKNSTGKGVNTRD